MVDYVQEFNDSFARVTDPSLRDRFLDRFYDRFIKSDELVRDKFRETDLPGQKEMLGESLVEMARFFKKLHSNPYLLTLARIHGGRGHDIPPRLYATWLDCLVATVAEVDPESTANVEVAWRMVMAPGIEFMKFYRTR